MTRTSRLLSISLISCCAAAFGTWQPVIAEKPEHVQRLKETGSCPGCDLSSAQLAGVTASGDLQGANLTGANLTGASFQGANCYTASFGMAELKGAKFAGANLANANLKGARNADLSGSITNERTVCPNGTHGPCS